MSVGKADSSNRPQAPKPEPKPVEQSKPQTPTAQTQQPTRNEVKPQPAKDGFESGSPTSTTRNQQAEKLGGTSTQTAGGTADAGALAKVGLTKDDLVKAGEAAAPHLEKAAKAAVDGKYEEALGHIRNAALAEPEIAEKAIKGLAKNLPDGPAKTLLTDAKVAKELVGNNQLHETIGKLIDNPLDKGALRELVNNDKARDAALGALSNDPTIKSQLAKVGLEPKDLVQAGKAAPKILDAFEKLQKGDIKGGLTDFQAAVKAAPDLAAKLGNKLVEKLPQGVKDQFNKLGITPEQLKTGGPALPHLFDAADAAAKGDWAKAYGSIKDAAAAAPDLAAQAFKGLAKQLPDSLGAAKSLLTDDKFLKELVTNKGLQGSLEKLVKGDASGVRELLNNDKARDAALTAIGKDPGVKAALDKVGLKPEDLTAAGKAAPKLWDAFEKIQKGDIKGGLTDFQKAVESAPDLAAKLGNKLVEKLPQGIKDQFNKLGITPEQLKTAGPALPHLYDAADAAVKGDWAKAYGSIKEAAAAAPDLATQALKGLAGQLPDKLGAAKSLLTDDKFLKELVTNKGMQGSLEKIFKGDTSGFRELLNNDKARDATLTAIGKDKGVTDLLAKAGLTPKDLVDAGKAAPKLWDAFDKLQKGDIKGGLTDFQNAVETSPELATKLGNKLLEKLPQGIKDQFNKLGITPEQLKTAGPALPHLYDAADAAVKGDWAKAYGSIKDAAAAAPDLATQALKGLAGQLPDSLGAAKTLLTDDKFLKELVTNKGMQGSLEKIFKGDTSGFRELLNNDKARDATLTAIGNDKGVKDLLAKAGLEPKDLVDAGKAAPKLWDAFEKIQKGDIKGGLTDFQKAVETSPQLAAKLGDKLISKLPQGIKDQFNKLGITSEQLKTAGPALPHLYDAADAAVKGDWAKAYGSIKDAAAAAPDLAAAAFKGLAKQLPDSLGAAKTLLTDDKFLKELVTNKELQGSLEKLVKNPADTTALRELLNNDKARDAALGAISNDPAIKEKLAKFGLAPEDLVQAGKAAPKILDAFEKISKGDIKGGLQDFQKAVESAPQLAAKLGEKVINSLPQGIKDQFSKLGITPEALKTAGPALPHLFDAADAASKGEWGKAVNSLKEAAISAPDLTAQALKGIANQLPAQLGAVKTLLTDEKFLKEVVSNRDLHGQLGKLFDEKTRMEGLRGLLGNDKVRDAALTALGNDPAVKAQLDKVGLTPEDLKQAGKAAPHVFDAVKAFTEGKLDEGITALGKAVEQAPDLAKKLGEKLVSKLPEGVRKAVSDLGITPSDLVQAGKALPDLINAGKALSQGDFQAAFTSLKNAAGKMPPAIVEKAITTAASKLPDNAFGGLAKSLLTNKDFVHELVTNKDLHASFDKMMKGEFTQGLKEMLGNTKVRTAAANALATNKDFMDKLKPFGIESAKDLEALGGSAFDVLEAGKLLAEGKGGDALKKLGGALGNVPADLRSRMVGKLAEKLGVPEWAKDTLTAAAGLLGNEQVGKALGDAFSALKKGDISGFVAGIANTGKTIAQTAPETAKAFLNSLSKIPGSLGKLFADRELNAAMVDSGAAANMFTAAEKLARGDVGGALNEIASAGMSLLTQGEHFSVAGQELPFGQKGIDNLTRMFGRFVDALPDKLKQKIAEKAATFAAKAGLKSIPLIGNIASGVSAIGSAKDLWDALHESPKDPVKVALAAGQLGLDVAGVVPGLNSITGPLQMVLGTASVIKGATDLIGDVKEFQQSLVGG